jgi:FAD/FMN-containing dehydrogenase
VWRDLQKVIDKHNLSVKIMQTYANFTVGGSVSVNCHGRYIGHGPIVSSVLELKLITASGQLIVAKAASV